MKLIFGFLVVYALLFDTKVALGDCSATSFIFDAEDEFLNERSSFDWCFKRVEWWGLNKGDGWRGRYCSAKQYKRDNYVFWTGRFRHQIEHRFYGRNGYDIFDRFGRFYGGRIFRGFNARIEFSFDRRCGSGPYLTNDDLPLLYN